MMAKTPYELRFDLLALASEHLTNEYTTKIALMKYMYDTESATMSREMLGDPKYPTIEEIMAFATRLQAFVNDAR